MLEIANVNQFYGESHTLWDVKIDVAQGDCVCLMGRNGVGKTTLLRAVMGLLPVRGGEIRFGGEDIAKLGPEQRARIGIGYVPQGREIFSQLTVEENLRVGLPVRKDRKKEVPEFIFELFPVLKKMLRRRGGDLSGGQQQQLAIGRALVIDPKMLILDEPTEGIQPNVVREIGEVIVRLNKEHNLTVLFVEQKLAFARRVGQKFFILDRGRNVAQGDMSDLNDQLVSRYLVV